MRVGYVRVSTVDQNTVRQLEGVQVEKTYTDTASGKDTARPQLTELLAFVRDGDTVLVHSMDRLARNLEDLRRIVRTLTDKGVRVEFVHEHLVFTGEDSPMATLMLSVMGAFAEFERALILERQREGIAAAKTRGVYTGRKPSLNPDQAAELRRRATAGEAKAALAREYRISRETVYSYLRSPADSASVDYAEADRADVERVEVEQASIDQGVRVEAPTVPREILPREAVIDHPHGVVATPESVGRVVDLSAELDAPAGTWQLVETDEGTWQMRHDGARVGTVRRGVTTRGRRGWQARLATGIDLAAHGDLAAPSSTLWRTRALAAGALARHFAQAHPARRRRRVAGR
ncbi:MAG: hypothetical protein QG597_187 [Actinomycetota bacterium]|nr:hypothetical protein [Actinomycetota bacterium]